MEWFASKFFDAVGNNFLTLLTSKNKVINLECLHRIYRLSNARLNRFLEQGEVMQCIIQVISEYHDNIFDEDSGEVILTNPRQKAWYIANNMEKGGWLRKEQKEDCFDFNMFLTDNAVKLVRNTDIYLRSNIREYTGYLQQIYGMLTAWKGQENSYSLMHRPVIETAFILKDALQDLNTYVKDMVKEVSRTLTYKDLFDNLAEFAEGKFLPQWTRLMEYDNRFLNLINNELNEIIEIPEYTNPIIEEYMKENHVTDRIKAEGVIYGELEEIREFISPTGNGLFVQIVMDIRQRLHAYVMTIWSRFQLLEMSGSQNTRDLAEQFLRVQSDSDEDVSGLFYMTRNEQINTNSFKRKRKKRVKYAPKAEKLSRISASELAEAKKAILKQLNDPNSKENIRKYLHNLMDGKVEIRTEDFNIDSRESMITTLQAIGYASDLGYNVEINDGYYETGDFSARNVTIKEARTDDQ